MPTASRLGCELRPGDLLVDIILMRVYVYKPFGDGAVCPLGRRPEKVCRWTGKAWYGASNGISDYALPKQNKNKTKKKQVQVGVHLAVNIQITDVQSIPNPNP